MQRDDGLTGAERARWLAELAAALDEARNVLQELSQETESFETLGLSADIEALRADVAFMRLHRNGARRHFSPNWMQSWPTPAVFAEK